MKVNAGGCKAGRREGWYDMCSFVHWCEFCTQKELIMIYVHTGEIWSWKVRQEKLKGGVWKEDPYRVKYYCVYPLITSSCLFWKIHSYCKLGSVFIVRVTGTK